MKLYAVQRPDGTLIQDPGFLHDPKVHLAFRFLTQHSEAKRIQLEPGTPYDYSLEVLRLRGWDVVSAEVCRKGCAKPVAAEDPEKHAFTDAELEAIDRYGYVFNPHEDERSLALYTLHLKKKLQEKEGA